VAQRYPRDAYFTVVARDVDGRIASSVSERVGRFTIDLPAEMVLLSLPLVTYTTLTEEVFSPIEGHWDWVQWYDASTASWKSYVIGHPSNDLLNVDRTMGLWLHLTTDGEGIPHTGLFTVVGDIPVSTDIDLYWSGSNTENLVGYPYLTVQYHNPFGPEKVQDATQDICCVLVETYDPTSPPYYIRPLTDEDHMLPGLGYWITVTCSDTWTITNNFPVQAFI
jgi:hypothetical protein